MIELNDNTEALLDTLHVPVLCMDQNYNLLYSNKAAADLFKFDKEVDAFSVFQFTSPVLQPDGSLSMDKADLKVAEALEKGRTRFQWLHQTMENGELPSEVELRTVLHKGETCILAYVEPLAAHPESINASVEDLQKILDAAPMSVTVWDEEYNIQDCNKETLDLFGIEKKRDYKEHFMELMPMYQPNGEPAEQFLAYAERAKEEGEVTFEWLFQRTDGELLPAEVVLVWQGSRNMTSYVKDLRLVHSYMEQIREANEHTKAMVDAMPLACDLWDENQTMIDSNPAALKLFGIPSKQEYCEKFFMLSPEYQPNGRLSSEVAMEKVREAFEKGEAEFEWMHQHISGEPIPAEVKLVRVKMHGADNLVGYIRDVRELKATLQALVDAKVVAEEANVAKSTFLSNMSHEIRTPMNAIIGMADLLAHEDLTDQQRKFVNDIKISSTSLLSIINEILDFSKIEAGKFRLEPVDFNLPELLANVESMFAMVARQKGQGLDFLLEMQDGLPKCLYGDDIRIRQILVNTIGNAIKFTSEGYVKLRAFVEGDMLCFDVSDTGIGIKTEELVKVFESFEQLDSGKARSAGGTGLGLSITKTLVDMMGGAISAESVYGEGTTFHIAVPLVLGDESALEKPAAPARFVSAPDAKVLVVDDNEINLNVAAGLLKLFDIKSDLALSGKEAISKIENTDYDLVFMDHMMPDMDGVETTEHLRESGYGSDRLPIVALTANAIDGVKNTLLDAGMDDYLSKPIEKSLLNGILIKWLPPEKVESKDVVEEEAGEDTGGIMRQAKETVPELDVGLALSRVNGMTDVLEKSLEIMGRRLPEVCGRLEGFLAAGDANGFAIEVHGSKGSLNNVGATELAQLAEAMELKAKEGDLVFCKEKLPAFIEKLNALHEKLDVLFMDDGEEDEGKKQGNAAILRNRMAEVKALLDSFETDEAVEMIQDASQYDYGKENNLLLKEILRYAEEFDYDNAILLIDKIG